MGRQAKPRKPENSVGKGKVTPVQVAFIVDRYLADNNYSETRSIFRTEASSLLAKSTAFEAPKTLLTLGVMLDEYICLKEEKVILEQEKSQLEQEKSRVQALLQGMQDLMNIYNSNASCSMPQPPAVVPSVAAKSMAMSPLGFPPSKTPGRISMSMQPRTTAEPGNFSSPVLNYPPPTKRKSYKVISGASQTTKKSCNLSPSNQFADKGTSDIASLSDNGPDNQQSFPPESSLHNPDDNGASVQESSVARNLFNQSSQSPMSKTSGPNTPSRAVFSQSDKSISPLDGSSSTEKSNHHKTPQETTPTSCTIISSKTIIVSPCKENSRCSIERNHCTFSSPIKSNLNRQGKRDQVKGRLDFDSSDLSNAYDSLTTSGSNRDEDLFVLDLPSADAFGTDFSLSELLTDFGIDCGGIDYACQATLDASTNAVPGLLHESRNGSQGFLEHSSSLSVLTEKGEITESNAIHLLVYAISSFLNLVSLPSTRCHSVTCSDAVASVRSITKCIQISSPGKFTS
ncbi:hypothetical protein Nepgr_012042 [Nepenthes gracilis]|uniref:Uncharacterized protein n=1 Tax=Nepenthes gracilis TaxID=150966 RepID=A0AAD3XMX1_NEPGR|nr:hypothetical protein Nepgr_012042 [Nepenthes gracilis]